MASGHYVRRCEACATVRSQTVYTPPRCRVCSDLGYVPATDSEVQSLRDALDAERAMSARIVRWAREARAFLEMAHPFFATQNGGITLGLVLGIEAVLDATLAAYAEHRAKDPPDVLAIARARKENGS